MKKSHVVIIGGGFGGTYTAKYLQLLVRQGLVRITLINRNDYFLFTPLVHEVAVGNLSAKSVTESMQDIFRKDCVNFIQDEIRSIDTTTKQVITNSLTIPYDYLVVSSGAETNYYGVPGAKENSFTLKDLNDAQAIHAHLRTMYSQKNLSCVVIGAGATGVELAGEIADFMKVTLVAASADVLPQFPPELRPLAQKALERKGVTVMTGKNVVEVQPGKILFADKTFLEAGTIIWVAGVKPVNTRLAGAQNEKSGRVKIDEFLRVVGLENIYSLGDVSGTAPQLAQVASQQAKIVARNISATISQIPLTPFIFRQKGLLVSVGQWSAVGKIFGIVLTGPFMWWIWRTVYLFNFHSWKKRLRIAVEWTMDLFRSKGIR